MQWPARILDLKPTEHIWDQMGLFIRDMDNTPITVTRLREAMLQAWGAVTPERIEILVRGAWMLLVSLAMRSGHIIILFVKLHGITITCQSLNRKVSYWIKAPLNHVEFFCKFHGGLQ